MKQWRAKAIDILFLKSSEKNDYHKAALEWVYNGNCIDYREPSQTCQLCEQTGIRYHYEIENNETNVSMFVGSECINKFGIVVRDKQGKFIDKERVQKFLKDEVSRIHEEEMARELKALGVIARNEGDFDTQLTIEKYYKEFKRNGGFSPEQVVSIFCWYEYFKQIYTPELYKIFLGKSEYKDQFILLPDELKEDLLTCLTSLQINQIKKYELKNDRNTILKRIENINRNKKINKYNHNFTIYIGDPVTGEILKEIQCWAGLAAAEILAESDLRNRAPGTYAEICSTEYGDKIKTLYK